MGPLMPEVILIFFLLPRLGLPSFTRTLVLTDRVSEGKALLLLCDRRVTVLVSLPKEGPVWMERNSTGLRCGHALAQHTNAGLSWPGPNPKRNACHWRLLATEDGLTEILTGINGEYKIHWPYILVSLVYGKCKYHMCVSWQVTYQ